MGAALVFRGRGDAQEGYLKDGPRTQIFNHLYIIYLINDMKQMNINERN